MSVMEKSENKLFDAVFLDNWHRHYQQLAAFLKQKAHDRAAGAGRMDAGLVKWVEIQRKIKNRLPCGLRRKLSALDLDLYGRSHLWEQRYNQLAGFVKEHGHAWLPADAGYEELKDWLQRQIQHKSLLSESRVKKLDALGIDWESGLTRDQRWEQMFLKLKEYRSTFGHCRVPHNWQPDKALANWVRVQRRQHARQRLCPDRERRLQELNFTWHIQSFFDARWQDCYQQVKAFYQAHGHCRVPGTNKQLTSWMENQKTARKKNLLRADREQQLNDLPFTWCYKDIKRDHWDVRYRQLGAFRKSHGHCLVPVNYKENKSLGYWVAGQRLLEAKGQLTEEKKKKLSRLGFVWSADAQRALKATYEARWHLHFEKLRRYKQAFGTCQVSLKINPALQRWTKWQRKLFYEGKLSEERIARLQELEFPWNIQEGYWMKMYRALTCFRDKHGHTRVPFQLAQHQKLAAWVYRQKLGKRQLSPQKADLLNRIGFDWELNPKTVVCWEGMYSRLLHFKQQYGHTRVPVKWREDPKLGKWVSRMRQQKENLAPGRLALLKKIEFDWGYKSWVAQKARVARKDQA
jgi:hypothetical protein